MMSHLCFYRRRYRSHADLPAVEGFDVKPGNGEKTRTGDYAFEIKDPDGTLVEFVQTLPDGLEAKAAGKFEPDTRIATRIIISVSWLETARSRSIFTAGYWALKRHGAAGATRRS